MTGTNGLVDEQAIFFSAVFGDEAGYVFVSTMDHAKKARGEPGFWSDRAFAYPAQRREILTFIKEQDANGCDVYFAVQLYGKPDARQKTLVRACPSAWSDLDTATPWEIDPQPSVILETSPGRFHGFWRSPVTMSPYEAEDISRRIAYAQHDRGADLGGWDLTQVLRIPGTHNHKYPDLPPVRLLKCDPTPISMDAFERFPTVIDKEDPWDSPEDTSSGNEPPVLLRGWDLEHWQQTNSADKSAWAQRMVAILKEQGLSDRLVEAALVDHPIYVAKAAEKWGGKRSAIIADIRRCVRYWKKHPTTTMFEGAPKGTTSTETAPPSADSTEYPLQTLHELVTTMPTEADQLIEGILWKNRITWVFAPSGSGKTLFVLAAALHMAAGRVFHHQATESGPVLLIEEDSPLSVLAQYVDDLIDIYEIDLATAPFWTNKQQGLRITDEQGLALAKSVVDNCPQKPLLVIIDACERLTPSDRFNTKEFDPLVRFLQWLIARDITPIVIDHTKKPASDSKKNDKPIKPLDLLYGAVAKTQICDSMIFFSGSPKTSIRVSFEKFRGETPPSFDIKFSSADGFNLKFLPYSPSNEHEQKIMAFFARPQTVGPQTPSQIRDATNLKDRTVFRALKSLVSHQLLLRDEKTGSYTANHHPPSPFQEPAS